MQLNEAIISVNERFNRVRTSRVRIMLPALRDVWLACVLQLQCTPLLVQKANVPMVPAKFYLNVACITKQILPGLQ